MSFTEKIVGVDMVVYWYLRFRVGWRGRGFL